MRESVNGQVALIKKGNHMEDSYLGLYEVQ